MDLTHDLSGSAVPVIGQPTLLVFFFLLSAALAVSQLPSNYTPRSSSVIAEKEYLPKNDGH